jgi:protein SCO1
MATSSMKRQIILIIAVVAVIALLFGMWSRHNIGPGAKENESKPEAISLINATVLPHDKELAAFQLVGANQPTFTNADLKGHWSLVFFGFTNCPGLCPSTLTTLNKMYEKLTAEKQADMPQVVFISVDPDRDTPPRIAEYLRGFNKNFVGATGTQEQLDQLTHELSVLYMKITQPGHENDKTYTIDHSGTILVIDPTGNWYALFNTPHDANNIAKDYQTIVSHYQPEKKSDA